MILLHGCRRAATLLRMISAVVLAAGASTRMGTQKLLLPFGNEPLIRRTVRQVCDAGFDDVLVVLGSEHEATLAALDGLPVRHAVNMQFASGMGSSFRTAVEHLADSAAAMFALADQPFVTTNEYRTVLDTYREHAPPIVSVRYGEVMAPPHLFEREFFPELAAAAARRAFRSAAAPSSGRRSCSFRRICWWISIRRRTTSWPRAGCPPGGEGCRPSR